MVIQMPEAYEQLSTRTARAENRRKGPLSALRAHTKASYKTDLLWKAPRNAKAV
jgi:hypothetical protein